MSAGDKIKLSQYVFDCLVKYGIDTVFMITGGGAMHLNDAIGRCSGLNYICCHHEQACAIAAESYARVAGKPAALNVTTGPGCINALNGVFGAWTDSIPMLVVSGQVKRETCMGSLGLTGLRQLGDQEVDIISMARGVTKYAVLINDPNEIRYHLEKALYLTNSGRPGPCWLDIPVDVQAALIEPGALRGFDTGDESPIWKQETVVEQVTETLSRLQRAKRPVLMVGSGVRLANAVPIFEQVIDKLGIPVVTAWTAPDLIATDHPLYCGRPGTVGERAGNFVTQNADLLLIVGSRLNIRQVSYNWKTFAREAYKIQVDIDPAELDKPTVKPDMAVCSDAKFFLEELDRQCQNLSPSVEQKSWLAWSKERVKKYPAVSARQREIKEGVINPYHFMEILFKHLQAADTVVCANATASVVPFQVGFMHRGQRMFANSGDASMGYDLPAAVGAAVARKGERVVCLAGEGSIQMNLQELQTIVHHQFPVKIFVLNNGGYLSMRLTQDGFFKLRIGEGPKSGVSFPDMVKLAAAYGLHTARFTAADRADAELDQILSAEGPALIEVMLDPDQPFEPKTSSKQLPDGRMYSAPLEDMAPFLSAEELKSNMFIAPPKD